jgi:2-keto-4-pentenoate hydratase/2-oxohepta-3-ene-1,7-dioic acid hydratase in catechol pathway
MENYPASAEAIFYEGTVMRRLVRTTAGYFVRDGDSVMAVHASSAAGLAAAVSPDALKGNASLAALPGTLLAPVSPETIVLVGLNYVSHVEEMGLSVPTEIMSGPIAGIGACANGSIVRIPASNPEQLDYEGEFAIVMARDCSAVAESDVGDYVLGIAPCLDMTLRDIQMQAIFAMRSGEPGPAMADAKSFLGSKPLGPEILLVDGADLTRLDLTLETRVNGDLRQSAHISDFIFSIPVLVAKISQTVALKAGDIICTGTPAGVGMATGGFLVAGDAIELQVGTSQALTVTIA